MDKIEVNALLDQYESLLTQKQQDVCNLYYREDLSLQEISEIVNISRSGVYDTIQRSEKSLKDYEAKLGLVSRLSKRMALYQKIKAYNNIEINKFVDMCIDTEI